MANIARLNDDKGALVIDPAGINACFASYYSKLCSSRTRYSQEEPHNFLDQVTFPVLTPSAKGMAGWPDYPGRGSAGVGLSTVREDSRSGWISTGVL